MAIAKWADFSAGWPGAAALRAAGFTGVLAYVGIGSGPKRLTAAHYQDCVINGLQVLLVAELSTRDAEGGYNAGLANARAALADAHSLGIPDSVGIAAACDEHLTDAQIPTCVQYAAGFHDILGYHRTGAYGFGEFVDAVYAAGWASWYWRCGSAPTEPWMTFWQRNDGSEVVGGVEVDIDEQLRLLTEDDVLQDERDALFDIREQLCGSRNPGEYPGYPSNVPGSQAKLTVTDFVRAIDANAFAAIGQLTNLKRRTTADPDGATQSTVDLRTILEWVGNEFQSTRDVVTANAGAAVDAQAVAAALRTGAQLLTDADLNAVAKAVADETERRMQS